MKSVLVNKLDNVLNLARIKEEETTTTQKQGLIRISSYHYIAASGNKLMLVHFCFISPLPPSHLLNLRQALMSVRETTF